jgi:CheY-like chemotaxis protein
MPVLDGLEATRLIRNSEGIGLNKETPIIGLSANSFEEDVKIALEAGMSSYLGKPFSRDDLDKVIKDHLIA